MPSQGFHNICPLVFHACSIGGHGATTLLVYHLARQLIAARNRRDKNPTADQEAFIAGLLFAVHPVHTEAVAGIVGQAELLCSSLSIVALLCYMAAADGRTASWLSHWSCIAIAFLLSWAAALSKEVGITVVSAKATRLGRP